MTFLIYQNSIYNKFIIFVIIVIYLDDCIYRYFVCTERSGKWPNNKEKCTLLFKRCCEYIENGSHHSNAIHTRPEGIIYIFI